MLTLQTIYVGIATLLFLVLFIIMIIGEHLTLARFICGFSVGFFGSRFIMDIMANLK